METESGLRRISVVCGILAREGLNFVVDELDMRNHLPLFARLLGAKAPAQDRPQRFRRVLERLGGFYVKLGQLLNIRPDLVPREYCEEFAKLQDTVPPIPFAQVRQVVEQELGKPLTKVFADFSREPIGSASIAQVHTARLHSGEKVVIKVMRPGILEKFRADTDLMYFFAHRLEKRFKGKGFSPVQIVEEFEQYTRDELNFLEEGAHIDKFYKGFVGSKSVKIPLFYRDVSSRKVLVMEYINGVKLSSIISGGSNHHDRQAIAKNLFDLALKQVFQMDIFHADMHPGNILVLNDNRVALLDFGITGTLSSDLREKGVRLYVALVDKDLDEVFDTVTSMGYVSDESQLPAFKQEVRDIIEYWHGEPLAQVRITHVLHQILVSCVDHGIRLPGELMRLGKALVTIEGTCIRLYPNFNFVDESKPYLSDLLKNELYSQVSIKNILKRSLTIKSYLERLPKKAMDALDNISSGKVNVVVEAQEVGYLGRSLAIASDRISSALIITACIISGALLIGIKIPPYYQGFPLLSLILFGIAMGMSLLLFISFFRKPIFRR